MAGPRKRYSAELKTRVALEAIKGQKTANEIAAECGVHPTQIPQWKKQALDGLPDVFSTRASEQQKSEEDLIAMLYQQIGQLKVQVDWLEKQGVQFTSSEFVNRLSVADIRLSWDGRGRALDNIFVERLWRSVKYEQVYLKEYQTVPDAVSNLAAYFTFYNQEQLHQALDV